MNLNLNVNSNHNLASHCVINSSNYLHTQLLDMRYWRDIIPLLVEKKLRYVVSDLRLKKVKYILEEFSKQNNLD